MEAVAGVNLFFYQTDIFVLFSLLRLQNYDAACRLAQEIAENIHERNRQQRTGGNPAKVKTGFYFFVQ